jgi:hypothetical protein
VVRFHSLQRHNEHSSSSSINFLSLHSQSSLRLALRPEQVPDATPRVCSILSEVSSSILSDLESRKFPGDCNIDQRLSIQIANNTIAVVVWCKFNLEVVCTEASLLLVESVVVHSLSGPVDLAVGVEHLHVQLCANMNVSIS